jgi:hypothetical protein
MCKTQGASLGDVATHIPDHKSDAPSSGWLSLSLLTTNLCTIVLSMSVRLVLDGFWSLDVSTKHGHYFQQEGTRGLADRS